MPKVDQQDEWTLKAKNILKAELKRRGVTYRDLAEKLGDTEKNLNNKISRGGFSAAFFLQCLSAVEVQNLQIDT